MNARQARTARRRVRAGHPPAPTLHRVDTTELQHGAAPRFVAGCCSHDCAKGRACPRRKPWAKRDIAKAVAVFAAGSAIFFTSYFISIYFLG